MVSAIGGRICNGARMADRQARRTGSGAGVPEADKYMDGSKGGMMRDFASAAVSAREAMSCLSLPDFAFLSFVPSARGCGAERLDLRLVLWGLCPCFASSPSRVLLRSPASSLRASSNAGWLRCAWLNRQEVPPDLVCLERATMPRTRESGAELDRVACARSSEGRQMTQRIRETGEEVGEEGMVSKKARAGPMRRGEVDWRNW